MVFKSQFFHLGNFFHSKEDIMANKIILTIAIPTFNRATFLNNTLQQINKEMAIYKISGVEIVVSDNASHDQTKQIVASAISSGLNIRYILNSKNIGSDANIAQCFNEARGKYVIILGDDDLFVDGSLKWLISKISSKEYGVICMRSYGFEKDFRKEYPGRSGRDKEYFDAGEYLNAIGPSLTLISACAVNKDILPNLDAKEFCGGNLVQVHLVLRAMLACNCNLYSSKYHVACKRNNSGGYNFIEVFVKQLGNILDSYTLVGLSEYSVSKFNRKLIFSYLPFYILRQRLTGSLNQQENAKILKIRYGKSILLSFWLMPTVRMPRYLAIIWGIVTTLIGRIAHGDLRRGVYFLVNKFR